MAIQFYPDWTTTCRPKVFEETFGRPFLGPGFYLGPKDTLFVFPDGEDVTADNIWKPREGDVMWRVMIFNAPYLQTIFAVMGNVPNRGTIEENITMVIPDNWEVEFDGKEGRHPIARFDDVSIQEAAEELGLWHGEKDKFPSFTVYKNGEEVGGGGSK